MKFEVSFCFEQPVSKYPAMQLNRMSKLSSIKSDEEGMMMTEGSKDLSETATRWRKIFYVRLIDGLVGSIWALHHPDR